MRKTRLALLVLLASTIGVVVAGYYVTQKRNQMLAPASPPRLPEELHSTAKNWSWSQSSEDSPVVEARARDVREVKDSSRLELLDVELKIFSKAGDTYDLIRSKRAEFDQPADKIYSDGDVTIVIGLPAGGHPEALAASGQRYVEIRTSGLTYDNASGVASTDRPVHFQFQNGQGNSIGAVYDAAKHYLWMKSQAELIGAGQQAGMHIRAGELHYYEAEQKIEMGPWSRLERGGQGVEAGASTVYLDKGDLKRIEAQQGKGWDNSPTREVRFSGDRLEVNFTPEGFVGTANGIGNARVVSTSPSGVTTITGDRVDLEFTPTPDGADSELSTAVVLTHARVQSVPAVPQGRPQPQTKILSANMIKVAMRPGGREVQTVQTLSPGELDFLPNLPSQWKRTLTAERITALYQPGNHIDQLQAVGNVHLRNDPPPVANKPGAAPALPRLTWSDGLLAFFDPQTGQMKELRQWSHFRYEEGLRKAEAGGARYDVANDSLALETGVRVWDPASRTTADFLVLDQRQDRLHAEGHVTSTHSESTPPHPGAGSDSLFATDQPIHATAQRFDAEQHNTILHYSGAARLWQDGNSVQAQQINLDRNERTLHASGSVVSVLVEDQPPSQATPAGKPAAGAVAATKAMAGAAIPVTEPESAAALAKAAAGMVAPDIGTAQDAGPARLARGRRASGKMTMGAGMPAKAATDAGSSSRAGKGTAPANPAAGTGVPARAVARTAADNASRLVTVTSDSLLYTEADRRAYYTGHVVMHRDRMLIHSGELEAFLRPQQSVQSGESRIDHLLARNHVELLETSAEKHPPRTAHAEQAEYFSGEDKVVLRGGTPTLEQPGRGSTRGAQLTYYMDDDRLLVNGEPGARSETRQILKRN